MLLCIIYSELNMPPSVSSGHRKRGRLLLHKPSASLNCQFSIVNYPLPQPYSSFWKMRYFL